MADTPKDCLTALLRGLGAPPYAVDRIVADAVSQGILATVPEEAQPTDWITFEKANGKPAKVTAKQAEQTNKLARVEALAKDLEASGSPAIRGVAKKLREALDEPLR